MWSSKGVECSSISETGELLSHFFNLVVELLSEEREREIHNRKSIKTEVLSDKEKKHQLKLQLALVENKIGNPIKINCKKEKFEKKEIVVFWAKSKNWRLAQFAKQIILCTPRNKHNNC